ncbi:MBL fold metallo-hydrolase [Caenimonas sedimenti]|uniref:MBL fold metallo-hydrolase n=1 Tax=Caenimonas sedimenti TaxID=2596921 RepID=A0A562ZWP9_9BURK|nr:MBL fold metallo-hydrolase [Caenimonas sedimenti]TWO72787.1 MBL fold metallo-hydrolase [Caenimonas sedimenti]
MTPLVQPFRDAATGTVTYVLYERPDAPCAIVDPVLDYDASSGRTSTASAERVMAFLAEHRLQLEWILETHAHADHLSAAAWLRELLGGRIAAGRKIVEVQVVFKELFHLEDDFATDGSQFDKLFADGETFSVGQLAGKAITVPGHTPACVAYQFGDIVFVGDTLLMPDLGTARCDFPGGSAAQLYRSVRRLLQLPPATRLFVCHDEPPADREPRWETTVAEQRRHNIHLNDGVTEEEFVALRNARDASLGLPPLMLPAVQVNIRAGQLPPPEANGVAYLKIPLNLM